ncbi:MAG: Ada metal-binding domain-containing protein [Dictyoglomus sp.]|uniref:Ada metal-binding domain-containing protein n=1 Tax=Dictyoglomus sp. TaxID=28205 RepID=UPI003D0E7E7B
MVGRKGFSLLEILIVLGIIFIIVSISIPLFLRVQEDAKRNSQIYNLSLVQLEIEKFYLKNGRFPSSEEIQNLLTTNFVENPICPYNSLNYIFTSNITAFRNALKNNNFNNAHIIYYYVSGRTYTLWYYPPKFYVGNKATKIFHYPWCWTLPAPQNQVFFNTREEAINNGYRPCDNCQP